MHPVKEETMAVVQEEKLVPQERVQQPTVEHAPVPQILEETVEVVRLSLHERVQQRTVDVPVPQVLEETVEMGRLAVRARATADRQAICGCASLSGRERCSGSCQFPQLTKNIVEEFSDRLCELLVDVPVPQLSCEGNHERN